MLTLGLTTASFNMVYADNEVVEQPKTDVVVVQEQTQEPVTPVQEQEVVKEQPQEQVQEEKQPQVQVQEIVQEQLQENKEQEKQSQGETLDKVDIEKLLEINAKQAEIQEQERIKKEAQEEAEKEKLEKEKAEKESANSSKADKLISVARAYLGRPYIFGATGPSSFDCSGYTSYVYRQLGIYIPRVASSQAYSGTRVSKSNLQKGDLVFFNTYGSLSHVGIYIEDGNFIHASSYGRGVVVSNLYDSYYSSRYASAARYL